MTAVDLATLARLEKGLYAGSELVGTVAPAAERMPRKPFFAGVKDYLGGIVDAYRSYAIELGKKYGVIPNEVAADVIGEGDLPEPTYLGRAGELTRKYVNRAIASLSRQFSESDGVIPYNWSKLKVAVGNLPGWYATLRDGTLKKIGGVLGMYIPEQKTVVMDECLMKGDYIGGNETVRGEATRHEFYHFLQDVAGTIARAWKNLWDPVRMIEGEATIFGGGEGLGAYRGPVKEYRTRYGETPNTSFAGHASGYLRELGQYFGSLFGPQQQMAPVYARI
jgi:hypothetical protein